jgi:trehalose 6-phosphate synthase/phosphatase
VPIHYLYRSISRQELVALYLAADVMAVTPVRDGMNLVAKEFAASRVDDDGVLLLSEFAGAAEELTEAILVNPYDVEATADAMQHALRLPEADRQSRMRALRQRVHSRTVHRWASAFVQELQAIELPIPPAVPAGSPPDAVERVMAIDDPVLLLDYDGTLVSIENLPQLARPDADLLPLLRALTEQVQVHLISGRSRTDLDAWFEGLPVTIWAEHGACVRREAGVWDDVGPTASDWMGRVRPILEWFTACTPGTLVEEKHTALAWHYRTGDAEFVEIQAQRLRSALLKVIETLPVELLQGSKVLEVRPRGVSKAEVVTRILSSGVSPSRIVAIGDDRTDEDMFMALPSESVTVHVGAGRTAAQYQLAGVGAVRALLHQIAERSPRTTEARP